MEYALLINAHPVFLNRSPFSARPLFLQALQPEHMKSAFGYQHTWTDSRIKSPLKGLIIINDLFVTGRIKNVN